MIEALILALAVLTLIAALAMIYNLDSVYHDASYQRVDICIFSMIGFGVLVWAGRMLDYYSLFVLTVDEIVVGSAIIIMLCLFIAIGISYLRERGRVAEEKENDENNNLSSR